MRTPGYSLIELTVVLVILLTLSALGTPLVLAARDDARARSAADHLASQLHLARFEALKRHVNVALRFSSDVENPTHGLYADGNGNGVRTAEIGSGADPAIRAPQPIGDQFPGVTVSIEPGVPDLDGEAWTKGDGVRVGASRMISFSPLGTSTSGTIYVLGRRHRQFAVRVLGPMGRVRVFEYGFTNGQWRAR